MAEDAEKQAPSTHDILEAEKQKDIDKKIAAIAPYMWKKGQSGNPTLIFVIQQRSTPSKGSYRKRQPDDKRQSSRVSSQRLQGAELLGRE
jgi:hypothetical protein